MPGQIRRRAEFYYQLAQMHSAGLGLIQSLDQLQRGGLGRTYYRPLAELRQSLDQGFTFTEAMRRLGSWTPEFDIALIQAGEESGRLDTCLRLLADYYTDRAQTIRQAMADLVYPVVLLHMAVFLFPFAEFFTSGNLFRYVGQTFGVLVPIYAVVGLMIFILQSRHAEGWRAIVERLLGLVPVLGNARRSLALARLSAALEALTGAGVNILQSWKMAGEASGSPALRRAIISWDQSLAAGESPAELIASCGAFPSLFATQYATGEISGQLDDTFRRLHRYYHEEGTRKLHAFAQWTPRLVYLIIVVMIAYRIIGFWSGYFRQVQDAGGF